MAGHSDTALGDWYVNRLTVDRKPLLLLVSSHTLLPIVIPARQVGELPRVLPNLVQRRLERLGIDDRTIASEISAMSNVVVTKTIDRSVVGILVEFAHAIPFFLARGAWNETTLPFLETWLAQTPCYAGRPGDGCVFPDRDTPPLLASRWVAS